MNITDTDHYKALTPIMKDRVHRRLMILEAIEMEAKQERIDLRAVETLAAEMTEDDPRRDELEKQIEEHGYNYDMLEQSHCNLQQSLPVAICNMILDLPSVDSDLGVRP